MAHEFEGEPGMLGASQAAVLLLPTRREVRTTYGLQLAHEEFRRASNLRQHLRGHDGLPESARAASTDARFLESLSGPLERAAAALDERKARRSFPDTELVEAAAGLVHAHGHDARLLQLGQEMEWRSCAGRSRSPCAGA